MGIDDDISRLMTQIANLERQTELLRAELRGMQLARKYFEDQPIQRTQRSSTTSDKPAKRGGRQVGAISNRWKDILFHLFQMDAAFDETAVVEAVFDLENRRIKPAEVRRIFQGYAEHNYIEIGERGLYRITDEAASKFGFNKPVPPPPIPTTPVPPSPPRPPRPPGSEFDDVLGELTEIMGFDKKK